MSSCLTENIYIVVKNAELNPECLPWKENMMIGFMTKNSDNWSDRPQKSIVLKTYCVLCKWWMLCSIVTLGKSWWNCYRTWNWAFLYPQKYRSSYSKSCLTCFLESSRTDPKPKPLSPVCASRRESQAQVQVPCIKSFSVT